MCQSAAPNNGIDPECVKLTLYEATMSSAGMAQFVKHSKGCCGCAKSKDKENNYALSDVRSHGHLATVV